MKQSNSKVNGHYQISLPWRARCDSLLKRNRLSKTRLAYLQNRLGKDRYLKAEYIEASCRYLFDRRSPTSGPRQRQWSSVLFTSNWQRKDVFRVCCEVSRHVVEWHAFIWTRPAAESHRSPASLPIRQHCLHLGHPSCVFIRLKFPLMIKRLCASCGGYRVIRLKSQGSTVWQSIYPEQSHHQALQTLRWCKRFRTMPTTSATKF